MLYFLLIVVFWIATIQLGFVRTVWHVLEFMPTLKQVAPVLQKQVKWASPGPVEAVNGGVPCHSIHAFFCPEVC